MRLSDEARQEIRNLAASGVLQSEIARMFEVSIPTVWRIVTHDVPRREWDPAAKTKHSNRCPGCGKMVYVWPCLACMVTN
jgi:hypothetical protein